MAHLPTDPQTIPPRALGSWVEAEDCMGIMFHEHRAVEMCWMPNGDLPEFDPHTGDSSAALHVAYAKGTHPITHSQQTPPTCSRSPTRTASGAAIATSHPHTQQHQQRILDSLQLQMQGPIFGSHLRSIQPRNKPARGCKYFHQPDGASGLVVLAKDKEPGVVVCCAFLCTDMVKRTNGE